jgi:hypothetical protein
MVARICDIHYKRRKASKIHGHARTVMKGQRTELLDL